MAPKKRKTTPKPSSSETLDNEFRARVQGYIDDVIAGRRVVGKLERRAVERHIRDLEHGHDRGLHFSEAAALRFLKFCKLARHYKGKFAGKRFEPEPWQAFIGWCLFGWLREDGTRRFRQAYLEVAKKNGKSFFLAVIALYLEIADKEAAAEVYSAATKRDQAKIVWGDAVQIVKRSPELSRFAELYRESIVVPRTVSKFVPLGADADTLDGLNVHAAAIDEVHAHKDRNVVDQLLTATAARTQPLVIYITTAGWDRNSICWEKRKYGVDVLEQVFEDDAYFAYVATLDQGDDWKDEACWPKANPNLGVSVEIQALREMATQAKRSPAFENNFKRYRLNVWTSQVDRWLQMEAWDACDATDDTGRPVITPRAELIARFKGRSCYGGLDLSSTQDLTAFVLEFQDEPEPGELEGVVHIIPWLWLPKDTLQIRQEKDGLPWDVWTNKTDGWVEATDGNTVDYRIVRKRIQEAAELFDIRAIAYDPANAQHLVSLLQDEDGIQMVEWSQRTLSMAPPTKDLHHKILNGRVRHYHNPVMRWMASNCAAHVDAGQNVVVSKKKSTEKVDGFIAWVMARGVAIMKPNPDSGPSRYSQPGAEMFFL